MKFVSPEYHVQLTELAEQLVTPERYARDLGQLVLFEELGE